MARTIEYIVDVKTGDSLNTLGRLEDELEQINAELKDVDLNSQAFDDLSRRAQAVTQDINKANLRLEGFTDERKLQAFRGGLDIVAGGFTAMEGVIASLGIESDGFEKTMQRLFQNLAIIQGIREMGEGILDLREALKASTVAQRAFNVVARANPYFLLATALVAVTAAVYAFAKANEEALETQQKLNDEIMQGIRDQDSILGDENQALIDRAKNSEELVKVQEDLRKQFEEKLTNLKEERESLNSFWRLNTAAYQQEVKNNNIQIKLYEMRLKSLDRIVKSKQTDLDLDEASAEAYRKLSLQYEKAIFYSDLYGDSLEKQLRIQIESAKYHLQRAKDLDVEEEKIWELEKALAALNKQLDDEIIKRRQVETINSSIKARGVLIDLQIREGKIRRKLTDEELAAQEQIRESLQQLQLKKAQAALQDELTTEARKQQILTLSSITATAFGNLSQLYAQGSKEQKAFALAAIAINTGVGFVQGLDIAQKSAAGTGPAAAFAFPIFYASQIAAVLGAAAQAKQILSTGVQTSGTIGSTGTFGPQVATPTFGEVFGDDANAAAPTATPTLPPVRAYVLQGDITNNTQAEKRLRTKRTFNR